MVKSPRAIPRRHFVLSQGRPASITGSRPGTRHSLRIVDAGLVGLHTASGAPHIVPPGATRPARGTNPIALGFRSADGPVIFDIGTASLMRGKVLLAAETGVALSPGVAFDADGNPTEDGRAAARGGVAAFGGHKGYGMAFAIQALGLLAGAAIPRGQVQDYGFLFRWLAIVFCNSAI